MKISSSTPVGTVFNYCGKLYTVTRPVFLAHGHNFGEYVPNLPQIEHVWIRPVDGKKAFCVPVAYVNTPQILTNGKWTIDVEAVKKAMY